jgi:hypothetical protein
MSEEEYKAAFDLRGARDIPDFGATLENLGSKYPFCG